MKGVGKGLCSAVDLQWLLMMMMMMMIILVVASNLIGYCVIVFADRFVNILFYQINH